MESILNLHQPIPSTTSPQRLPPPTISASDAIPRLPTYDQVAAALLALYQQLKDNDERVGELKTENEMVWTVLGIEQKMRGDEKMEELKEQSEGVLRLMGVSEREVEGLKKEKLVLLKGLRRRLRL